MSIFDQHLPRTGANHTPLSPLTFLERAASTFPARTAVVYGALRYTWAETQARCRRLASALRACGVEPGDTVSVMLPNVPAMLEAHFGVPMSGAVLHAINTRLEADTIAYMLEHAETRVLLADPAYAPVLRRALAACPREVLVVDVQDPTQPAGQRLGEVNYDTFLAGGSERFEAPLPTDEWNAISVNYTSGTTGRPKGVVYHHRGAYLNALGNVLAWHMGADPVYLWTLPMFHCNGWCFPWTIAALAGTNVCLRAVREDAVYAALRDEGVTHLCGAPVVLSLLAGAPEHLKREVTQPVEIMTAASPPPAPILEAIDAMGWRVTHTYGLTETYGPAVVCEWDRQWDALPTAGRVEKLARQGVRYPVLERLDVLNGETLAPTPHDGASLGEIMFRGNIVMKGYLKDPQATAQAFAGDWFHSSDLAVTHADGYVEIRDRSKDIIISGGENISSIEVEKTLYRHPAVMEAAVVARPDPKWGETPCAFVTLREGVGNVSAAELIAFCREHMASFKAPKTIVFGPLPKTATGKVQKFQLRRRAEALDD